MSASVVSSNASSIGDLDEPSGGGSLESIDMRSTGCRLVEEEIDGGFFLQNRRGGQ